MHTFHIMVRFPRAKVLRALLGSIAAPVNITCMNNLFFSILKQIKNESDKKLRMNHQIQFSLSKLCTILVQGAN
jgi:hypothetical protein